MHAVICLASLHVKEKNDNFMMPKFLAQIHNVIYYPVGEIQIYSY